MNKAIIGIDPGLHGALAIYHPDGQLEIFDVPIHSLERGGKAKNEVDVYALANIIDPRAHLIGGAVIEKVGARPGQGVTAMFAFGKVYGILIGVLAANFIPVSYVTPHRWQSNLRVIPGKDGSRATASQLFPTYADQWRLVKHDGRAEAALIALWGSKQL